MKGRRRWRPVRLRIPSGPARWRGAPSLGWHALTLWAGVALGVQLVAAAASAQPKDPRDGAEHPRIGIGLGLATLVELTRETAGMEYEQPVPGLAILDPDSRGLLREASYSLTLGFALPLIRHFSLAVEARWVNWESRVERRLGYGRYNLLDLSLVPRARWPIVRRAVLILGVPLGASFNVIDVTTTRRTFEEEAGVGSGFHLGLLFGGLFTLTQHVGLSVEVGPMFRTLSHRWRYTSRTDQGFVRDQEAVNYQTLALSLRVGAFLSL